eukprot:TRINITY_DN40227_c0_g1_i1.p1 TRINITY_DN40227_c0_g1~~TRINITY_DN40227_c0_g1_i1.p1  ORF type:complete len:625 (-),score=255.90 TRINITY_DN40227_c0_g1_i1:161-2035(-)
MSLLSKDWEAVQKKTFTKWANSKLKLKGVAPIENDMAEEFKNGVKLIQLLEAIGDESLGKYNPTPKMRIHEIENINLALKYIADHDVKLHNMGAPEIADGNEKLVLGMIWTIILRFSIADISEEGKNAKEGLLLWCQRKTKGYKDVDVKNFTDSWADGLAFCALIHRHRPDLLNFDECDKADARNNCEKAFEVAEKELGIARLLDAEDIVDMPKPDERSVMTYVASLFHYFSQYDKVETAGRRIAKFVGAQRDVLNMQTDYEERMGKLLAAQNEKIASWEAATFDGTYDDAMSQDKDFNDYKGSLKREWVQERTDLEALIGQVKTKAQLASLPPYNPPEGSTLGDLESAFTKLSDAESSRRKTISEKVNEIKDALCREFADKANAINDEIHAIDTKLVAVDTGAELEAQLEQVKEIKGETEAVPAKISELETIDAKLNNAHIEVNSYTVFSVADLQFNLQLLQTALTVKQSFLENSIVSRDNSSVSNEQLAEFEETFRHFDLDNSNTLTPNEFKAGMSALGLDPSDEEFEELFKKVSGDTEFISFEQFVEYMVEISEDKASPEQLRESFKAVAGPKDYVTEQDFQIAQVPEESYKHLLSQIPPKEGVEGGYDYPAYLAALFPEA